MLSILCHFHGLPWGRDQNVKLPKSPFSGCSPHSIPTNFDGVHPNENGYAIVGALVLAVIDKTLWK